MKKIKEGVARFFEGQGYVVVSTIDKHGFPHSSCKGIVKVDLSGKVYLLDVYKAETHANLKLNPHISITAIDEHKFMGFCLKGIAEIVNHDTLPEEIIRAWEDKITSRLTHRLLKNLREEKGHSRHPEVLLPKPEYMIVVNVEDVLDLTPHHMR